MGKLLAFLRQNSVEILFIALQFLCLYILIQTKSFHHSRWNQVAGGFTNRLLDVRSNVENYLSLKEQNEVLQRENARLRSLVPEMFVLDAPVYFPLKTQDMEQRYRVFPGKAINRSFKKVNNAILIDKGEKHGVYPGMAVIGPKGVVGIVKDVFPRYSTALAVIHSNMRLSVRLKSNNFFGTLTWDGRDFRFAQITDLPTHADIQIGDTVVTDSRSTIFPPGITVGVVDGIEFNTVGDFIHAQIHLSTDFSSLHAVYLVDDMRKEEVEEIIEEALILDN